MTTPDFLQNAAGDELHPRGVAGGEADSSVEAGDECVEFGENGKPWPPLRGFLKGKMWVDPDYDLTRPTFLDWAREVDDE